MLDQFKKIAQSTNNSDVPCTFLFGTVLSTSPLKVQVDNRFIISGAALVTLKPQSGGKYPTHKHKHICKYTGAPVEGEEEETYAGVQSGDKLALLRERGGQRYLVLGVIE